MTPTILITGSSGFIGFNLAKKLLQEGKSVIGIDNLNSDYDPTIKQSRTLELQKFPQFEFLKMDIVHDHIPPLLKGRRVDYFVHLAAKDLYYHKPLDLDYSIYIETQTLGTAKMFELAKKLQAKKFIFASTHSVYGNTKKGLLTEKKIQPSPISPHGASKLSAEEIVRFLSNYHKLPAIILRISSVYGPGMAPHTLIPSVIKSFKEGSEVKKYVDFENSSRDFIYIDDVVNYIISAFAKRLKFQIVNIASGKTVTLARIVDLLAQIMGKKIKNAQFKDHRQEFSHLIVNRVSVDISRAKKIFGFAPRINLEDGLRKTISDLSS